MSPTNASTVTDEESVKRRARGRPPAASRADLVAAAGAVFDSVDRDAARGVSMDVVAAAAGVGKATLFRAFGDRLGLLDALSAARFAPLRATVDAGVPPFDPATPAADAAAAFLDAVLAYKLDNANVLRARETAGPTDLRSERYRWTHAHLAALLRRAAPSSDAASASLASHAMLATLRIELLDELLAQGHPVDALRRAQADRVDDFTARHR